MAAQINRDQFSMLKMAVMQNGVVITQLNIYRKTVLKAWKIFKEEQTIRFVSGVFEAVKKRVKRNEEAVKRHG